MCEAEAEVRALLEPGPSQVEGVEHTSPPCFSRRLPGATRRDRQVCTLVLLGAAFVVVGVAMGLVAAATARGSIWTDRNFLSLVGVSAGCRDAQPGEECYQNLQWHMDDRKRHPGRYQGLDEKTSVRQWQVWAHQQGPGTCPMPCPEKQEKERATEKKTSTRRHQAASAESRTSATSGTSTSSTDGHDRCPDIKKYGKNCHDVVIGEACYASVGWAIKVGIEQHPAWYPGLKNSSSIAEFQAFLSEKHPNSSCCPTPCSGAGKRTLTRVQEKGPENSSGDAVNFTGADSCHTCGPGEKCFETIQWAMSEGINAHPEWYQTLHEALTIESSFEDFQMFLYKHNGTLPQPCKCHTATEGEPCYKSVKWAMQKGISLHSSWYPGLSPNSSFEDFQAHLNRTHHDTTGCEAPCRPGKPALGSGRAHRSSKAVAKV